MKLRAVVVTLAAVALAGCNSGTNDTQTTTTTTTETDATTDAASALDDSDATFGDGTYRVEIDIPAGKYRTIVPVGPGCVLVRLSSFSGKPDSIIRKRRASPGAVLVITIPKTDAAVTSQDCGVWRQ